MVCGPLCQLAPPSAPIVGHGARSESCRSPRSSEPKTSLECGIIKIERTTSGECVNGQFDVPAGGQLKVLTPCTAIRTVASSNHPLSGGPRAWGRTPRW